MFHEGVLISVVSATRASCGLIGAVITPTIAVMHWSCRTALPMTLRSVWKVLAENIMTDLNGELPDIGGAPFVSRKVVRVRYVPTVDHDILHWGALFFFFFSKSERISSRKEPEKMNMCALAVVIMFNLAPPTCHRFLKRRARGSEAKTRCSSRTPTSGQSASTRDYCRRRTYLPRLAPHNTLPMWAEQTPVLGATTTTSATSQH